MTSKIKVDNINKVSDDTNIIKKCGTTTTIGSGASNPIVVDGSAITLGRCGGTVALASGATQTGFGRTGTVNWQTTIYTNSNSPLTVESGKGYFLNTTSGTITINLPAGSAGDIVALKDYLNTWDNNNVTVTPNGSDKIGGTSGSTTLSTESQSVTLIFTDSTQGWLDIHDSTSNVQAAQYVAATGGTVTTVCTNFKVHTFTGPGTFCVSAAGNSAGSNTVDYLIVAGGGGGGGRDHGAGGGAGGYRESPGTASGGYTVSPLGSSPAVALPVTATGFPITVGSGGAGSTSQPCAAGASGGVSTFSTITSAGGGGGAGGPQNGLNGGSGGGGNSSRTQKGVGNTPPVSPPQGTDGKVSDYDSPNYGMGGGGGATAEGTCASPTAGGSGGAGATSSINGTPTTRAGGGGGSVYDGGTAGAGGAGGGGNGTRGSTTNGTAGTANTGGGGGGGERSVPSVGGKSGGSGIVIIRYKFQ